MKVKDDAGFVAVVTDADAELPASLEARMKPRVARLRSYPNVEQLVREAALGGLRVLVIWGHGVPKGGLLSFLARLNQEHPWVQKIAMLEVAPPLVLAEYLTYCGVEVIWTGTVEERVAQLGELVNRSKERMRWLGAV